LSGHGQLPSHSVDVMVVSFDLLLIGGGRRGEPQHGVRYRGM
jgi:hypothetical protein